MATQPQRSPLARLRPDRETLLWAAIVVNAELILLLVFALRWDGQLLSVFAVRRWVYPFVWINVGGWAVLRTYPVASAAGARRRRLVALLAVAYFAVLAYAGGLVGLAGHGGESFRVAYENIPPGWSPAVLYTGYGVSLTLVPFKVAGYLALAYLVYATVLDAAGSAVSGLLGLLSCVSCSWPVLASLLTGVAGGTAFASAVYWWSYDLSTAVFLVTVALLYWRPFGSRTG